MSNEIHIHIHIHTDAPLTANNELERVIAEAVKQALEAQKAPQYQYTPVINPSLLPPYKITSGTIGVGYETVTTSGERYFTRFTESTAAQSESIS